MRHRRDHLLRIEHVFDMRGADLKAVSCPAINGIIKQPDLIAEEIAEGEVLDADLIAAAQPVEHYEIARYETLISGLRQLGRDDCAAVLELNLGEEKAADNKLPDLAEAKVTANAVLSA